MNFEIDVARMQRIISVLATSSKANANDNTGRVLVRATKDELSFVVNNGETAAIAKVDDAIINETGEMVFSFSDLRTFIPKFVAWNENYGSKIFHFKVMKSGVFINVDSVYTNGKKSKGKIKLKEYPTLGFPAPEEVKDVSFILNSDIVKPAASKVLYAIDQNHSKAALRGVNLTFDTDNIYFAGTNGKMLSEYKTGNVSDCKEGSYVFKYEFLQGLNKILPSNTQVFFSIGAGKVMATFDDIILFGKLVIGEEYPKYFPVLNDFKELVSISRESLFESIKPLAESLDADDNKRITLSIKDRSLFLSSEYAEFQCEDDINYDGDFIIDINGAFMLKTIEAIKDDLLLVKFNGEKFNLLFDSGNFENQKALITCIKRRA